MAQRPPDASAAILAPLTGSGPIRTAAAVVAAVLFAGCGVHGLSFVQDERVHITAPDSRDEVSLPVTVTWRVDDFAVGEGAGSFGVFVDHPPTPPGRPLDWPFRNSDACRGPGGDEVCASAEFLAARGVHRTLEPTITLAQVADLAGRDRSRQLHEVVVVLLDANGRRVGEGAWSVEFEVTR